jgi:hypothetical protein
LRHFADGKHLQLFDKRTGQVIPRRVGTRDAFVEAGFNRCFTDDGYSDELEDRWAKLEGELLPWIRRLLDGDRGHDARTAARVFGALHFARSYGFRAA